MRCPQDPVRTRLLALALVLAAGEARGQVPRFASSAELVTLSATAVDSEGRPVQDLRPAELRIFEDGRPQKLEHFSSSRDSRARILLLMDASGSMHGELKATSTRMAAVQILNSLQADDEAALAAFDNKYWGVVRFTTDRVIATTLERGIADARYAGSGSGQQPMPDDLNTAMSEDPARNASPRERREGAVQFRLRASIETRDGATLWRGAVFIPLTLVDERRLGGLLAVTLVGEIGRTIDPR